MAQKYVKCKICGKIFTSFGKNECPKCLMEMEDKFKKIKNYLYEYPRADIAEVVENTGVDEKLILNFLKEGRLEMVNSNGILKCEKCGVEISSGRMCRSCMENISSALRSHLPKVDTNEKKQTMGAQSKGNRLHLNLNNKK